MIGRRKRPKMGLREPTVIKCRSHLQWIRGCECAIAGKTGVAPLGTLAWVHKCVGPMQAHHVTTRGAGGGDETAVPLCVAAHKEIHDRGVQTFQDLYGVDLEAIADKLWKISHHGVRWRREHDER